VSIIDYFSFRDCASVTGQFQRDVEKRIEAGRWRAKRYVFDENASGPIARRIDEQDTRCRGRQWPARALRLKPGEAHDNRLCSELLTGWQPKTLLLADRGYDADWIRRLVTQHVLGPKFHRSAIEKGQFVLALTFIVRAISSNGSSTRSNSAGASPPATTN
jgi:hypothetical protein